MSEGTEDGYGPANEPEDRGAGDPPGEGNGVSLGKRDSWAAPTDPHPGPEQGQGKGPRDAVPASQEPMTPETPAGPWSPPADTPAPWSPAETLVDVPVPPAQGENAADTPIPPTDPFEPPPAQGAAQGTTPVNPFAPPSPPTEQYNPFAPPSPATARAAGPWSPQPQWQGPVQAPGAPYGMPPGAPAQHANPFAPPGEPVPPPPVSPDGPGRMDYGYPGHPAAPYGYGRHAATGPGAMPYGGPGYGWPGMQAGPSNGMGIAALVLGIVSAVGFILWPIAIIVGILAIIFGGVGRAKVTKGVATNPGQALAGLICGIGGLILAVLMMVIVIANSDSSSGGSDDSGGYSATA